MTLPPMRRLTIVDSDTVSQQNEDATDHTDGMTPPSLSFFRLLLEQVLPSLSRLSYESEDPLTRRPERHDDPLVPLPA
jgi:hypothetical protein